jgi:quercetin dioxygenase-like cupin family protein
MDRTFVSLTGAPFYGGNRRMITRRDMLIAAISTFTAVAVMAFAQSEGKPVMHSCFFNWDDLKVTPTKIGAHRSVFDAPTPILSEFECHITTLNPGQEPHKPHRHPDEELMIIKQGTLEALQGDKTNIVTAGGIIFEASNELHGLRNIGTNQAVYYVIKITPHDLVK